MYYVPSVLSFASFLSIQSVLSISSVPSIPSVPSVPLVPLFWSVSSVTSVTLVSSVPSIRQSDFAILSQQSPGSRLVWYYSQRGGQTSRPIIPCRYTMYTFTRKTLKNYEIGCKYKNIRFTYRSVHKTLLKSALTSF